MAEEKEKKFNNFQPPTQENNNGKILAGQGCQILLAFYYYRTFYLNIQNVLITAI